jgi:hypothetical protein
MFKYSKKGQTSGLITGLIFGIASLVIAVIIAFVIVSTLTEANLLEDNRESVAVINESGYINSTGYTLDGASATRLLGGSFSITEALNAADNSSIGSGNYTVSDTGVVTNAAATTYDDALISYTYTLKTHEEVSTDGLSANFTDGVDNVSAKIPTVLLIAAIVLILGVLVLLVAAWQRMNIGGNGGI